MINIIYPYKQLYKNSLYRLFLILPFILISSFNAKAQFSLMLGGVYQNYTGAAKDYPFLIGFSPRVAFDIGERMQVSLNSNFEYPAKWEYRNNMRLEGVVLSTNVPVPVGAQFGLGVVEFSALYSYFLLGKNYSRAGLYASGGPGAAFYVSKLSGVSSRENFLNQHTDYLLDMRIGGQHTVAIGWVYLEGRLAPTLFSTGLPDGQEKPGALYGINLGVRYLLNRHPYCAD